MLYTPLISQAPRWSGLARQFNSVLHQASTGSASACAIVLLHCRGVRAHYVPTRMDNGGHATVVTVTRKYR